MSVGGLSFCREGKRPLYPGDTHRRVEAQRLRFSSLSCYLYAMLPLPSLLRSRARRFLSGLLLLGTALLLTPTPAQAQVEHFGLKAGVTSMTGAADRGAIGNYSLYVLKNVN